jgi:hypothetical protein
MATESIRRALIPSSHYGVAHAQKQGYDKIILDHNGSVWIIYNEYIMNTYSLYIYNYLEVQGSTKINGTLNLRQSFFYVEDP